MKLKPLLNRIWDGSKNKLMDELKYVINHVIQYRLYWPLLYITALAVIGLIAIYDYSQFNMIYFFKSLFKEYPLNHEVVVNQLNMLGWSALLLYVFSRFGRQLFEKWTGLLFHIGLVLLIIPIFQHAPPFDSRFLRLPYYHQDIEVAGFCLALMLPFMVKQLKQMKHPVKQWKSSLQMMFAWLFVSLSLLKQVHYPMLILWNLTLFILVLAFWKNRVYWKAGLLVVVFGVMFLLASDLPYLRLEYAPNRYVNIFQEEESTSRFHSPEMYEKYQNFIRDRLESFRFGDIPDSTHYHPFFDRYTEISLDEIKQSGFLGRGLGTFTESKVWWEQVQYFLLPKYIVFITFKQFGVPGFLAVFSLYTFLFVFLIRNRSEQDDAQLVQWSMILFLIIQVSIQMARTFNLAPLLPSYSMPFYGYGPKALYPAFIALGWIFSLYTSKTKDCENESKS